MTDHHANRAKSLLSHYLRMAVQSSGQRWDSDNSAEVDDIVDSIIDAAQAAQPSTINNSTAQPDALTRIADALERIADILLTDSISVRQDPAA